MDVSNDERWQVADQAHDLQVEIVTLKKSLEVIAAHTLHYDPMDPSQSLDSIYVEAMQALKTVEQFWRLFGASWVVIVAQIKGIPIQLPLTPDEVEALRQRLERR